MMDYPEERRTVFASTTGGVMTDEAGAVTGELELSCRPDADLLHVLVRYTGAEEWYTVSGSPVRSRRDSAGSQRGVIEHLRTPGPIVDGNEKPVSLEGFF
jgi:hypothetical protein